MVAYEHKYDPGYQIFLNDEKIHILFDEDDTEEEEENETDSLIEGEKWPSHSVAFDVLNLAFK
jgi:hypothetical protein